MDTHQSHHIVLIHAVVPQYNSNCGHDVILVLVQCNVHIAQTPFDDDLVSGYGNHNVL